MTKPKGQQAAETRLLPLTSIQTNNGQIPGLPKNPRLIRDERFNKLKKSIEDFPEMLHLREIVVFPYKRKFVCVGGNMRFLACKDLGIKQIPAKIVPAGFPVERLAEFAIKDNISFGQDDLDILTEQWNEFPLQDWGAELPDLSSIDLEDFFKDDPGKTLAVSHEIVLSYSTEEECERVRAALLKLADTFEAAVAKLLTK